MVCLTVSDLVVIGDITSPVNNDGLVVVYAAKS